MHTDQTQDGEFLGEKRETARNNWGGRRAGAGAKPRTQILRDINRAARLYDIAESPYQHLAFGNCSIAGLMRICARNLMEAGEFKAAARLLTQLSRQAKIEADAPRAPETLPGDRYELAVEHPPEDAPEPLPAPTAQHLRQHAALGELPHPQPSRPALTPASPATPEPARNNLDPPAVLARRAPPTFQPSDASAGSRQRLLASCALSVPDLGRSLNIAARRQPGLAPAPIAGQT